MLKIKNILFTFGYEIEQGCIFWVGLFAKHTKKSTGAKKEILIVKHTKINIGIYTDTLKK